MRIPRLRRCSETFDLAFYHGVALSVVTTYYVNGIYELETEDGGPTTEHKYYAGVAMRENDTLYFTLRDHLAAPASSPMQVGGS